MKIRILKSMALSILCAYTCSLTAAPQAQPHLRPDVVAKKNLDAKKGIVAPKKEVKQQVKDLKKHKSSSSSSSSEHRGPRGPRGYPGPSGPQGPAGVCECPNSFLSVYTLTGQDDIALGDAIIFDDLAIPVQGTAMTYNNTTGVVTFNETGFFEVTYGVSVDLQDRPESDSLQNAVFGVELTPGGVQPGSVLIFTTTDGVPYTDLLDSISVIVQVTSVGQTLKVVSQTATDCGDVATDAQNACAAENPVVAYLVVKQLA